MTVRVTAKPIDLRSFHSGESSGSLAKRTKRSFSRCHSGCGPGSASAGVMFKTGLPQDGI